MTDMKFLQKSDRQIVVWNGSGGGNKAAKKDKSYLMKRYKDPDQKLFMLCLEGECKTIDYTAQDLQEFAHTIEVFSFIHKPRLWSGNI